MDHSNELATTAAMPPPSVTIQQTVRRNPSIKRLLKLPIWSSGGKHNKYFTELKYVIQLS